MDVGVQYDPSLNDTNYLVVGLGIMARSQYLIMDYTPNKERIGFGGVIEHTEPNKPDPKEEPSNGMPVWVMILLIALCGFVGFVVYWLYRRMQGKRLNENLNQYGENLTQRI
jgi:hypothetical protein